MKLSFIIMLTLLLPLTFAQNSEVISGRLFLLIEDDFERGIAREIFQIQEEKSSKMYSLSFPDKSVPEEIKKIPPGGKISIRGKKDKHVFHFERVESRK